MRDMGVCVGCQEARGTSRVRDLGPVCDSCAEVVDIVFEVELERLREANRKLRAFLDEGNR